jgi:hypothetical protein
MNGVRERFPNWDQSHFRELWRPYRGFHGPSARRSAAGRGGLGGENVSAQVRKLFARPSEELSPEIQAWMKTFE